ncbi:MAG: DUF4124 domain-containing protein [Gammaproteobacteria bacterium]|nr:DUF4124 domain-containing protein [Gammaproteobacteria bacterium]
MKSLTDLIVSLALIIILSITFASFAAAEEKITEIYKWVDKDGRVHYAAKPGDDSAKKMHLGSNIFHDRKIKAIEAETDKQDKEREKLCQDSKDTLAKYKKAPFLYRYDAERKQKVRLTDSESKETFLQAEKDISYWCNPPQQLSKDDSNKQKDK